MTTALDLHAWELAEQGCTLLTDITTDEQAAEALSAFGELVPQYDGSLRYQVKAAPGFEERRYSKSVNTILVHTEAPGWNPTPSYLALHCRVQATCGSGHTELADMRQFVATLAEQDRSALYERDIEWVGHNTGGVGTEGVRRPVVERTEGGREIVRFSYNLLTTGQYDPPVDASVDPADLPLGSFGIHLAEQAEAFFRERKTSVLIPENSVLVWDNQRMVHARSAYRDAKRHLTRYWIAAQR
ncbi:TauD/TfdA family dioxygenase [Streptomyces sp. G-G2]|uniref:TauD/TfdA family dioxygenase n=1 Tax=Streptomyces sp. G-G2 TaxID=3046201 RepID=UPI0024B8E291|nr:TauD/TfdA family dioxygenase [Streptomyces sp. G-G2]MDJ0383070.1 TauD/TfdA family dioxygenase [Streptomyces sp. G-G2]